MKKSYYFKIVSVLIAYYPSVLTLSYFYYYIEKDTFPEYHRVAATPYLSLTVQLFSQSFIMTYEKQIFIGGFCLNLVLIAYLTYMYKKRFPLSKQKEISMRELGFYQNEKPFEYQKKTLGFTLGTPTYEFKKRYIIITTPNFTIDLEYLMSKKSILEQIFNITISEITKIPHDSKNIFKIHKDIFDQIEVTNDVKDFYKLNLGKNLYDENLVIDLKTQPFLGLFGVNGSGKTALIKEYIKLIRQSVDDDIEVHIIDPKGLDWKETITEGAIYHPAETEDDLKSVAEFLKKILALKEQSKSIIYEHGNGHAEDVRAKKIYLPLKRTLIVFDECSAYLSDVEPNKEIRELKKEIISYVDKCLRQLRASGVLLILANQTIKKDTLSINLDQLHNVLFNGLDKEMSAKHCRGLVGEFKTLSKWYLKSGSFNGFIKTPYQICSPASVRSKLNLKYRNWVLEFEDSLKLTSPDQFKWLNRNFSLDKLNDEEFIAFCKKLKMHRNEKELFAVSALRPNLNIDIYVSKKPEEFHSTSIRLNNPNDIPSISIIKSRPLKEKYINTHMFIEIYSINTGLKIDEFLFSNLASDEEIKGEFYVRIKK